MIDKFYLLAINQPASIRGGDWQKPTQTTRAAAREMANIDQMVNNAVAGLRARAASQPTR